MDRIIPLKAMEEGDLQARNIAKPQGQQARLSGCTLLYFGSPHELL